MEDKLKKYIDEHRSEFELPAQELNQLWTGIEDELPLEEKSNIIAMIQWSMRVAAAAIVIFGVWLVFTPDENGSEMLADLKKAQLAPELVEADQYYSVMIQEKKSLVAASNEDLDQLIVDDFHVLDSVFFELKQDLKDDADNEEVIEAMIQNYRIKLKILDNMLEMLQKNKMNESKDSYEIS